MFSLESMIEERDRLLSIATAMTKVISYYIAEEPKPLPNTLLKVKPEALIERIEHGRDEELLKKAKLLNFEKVPKETNERDISARLFTNIELNNCIQFINKLFTVDITSVTRDTRVSAARAIYFKYTRKYTKNEIEQIAESVGMKPVTVLSAVDRYDARIAGGNKLYVEMAELFAASIVGMNKLK